MTRTGSLLHGSVHLVGKIFLWFSPETAFPADHFFFAKKKRSAPQRKKPVRGRAEYSCLRRHEILLSPGRSISGRYALPLCGFRGRCVPLRGACVFRPGRAPQRGLNLSRKHCPVPPQAGRRTARFFTSFHGAGRRRVLPQALDRAFFFGSPKPFLFGSFQKEMGSRSSPPWTDGKEKQKKTEQANQRLLRLGAEGGI